MTDKPNDKTPAVVAKGAPGTVDKFLSDMRRYGLKTVTVTQSISDFDRATVTHDKEVGHTLILGGQSSVPRVSEWAFALHGRDFATLSELELNQFRALRAAGRKFGIMVSVEVMHDSDDIQAELAAASPAQQEEIYRRLSTQISVRWAEVGF
ncbi:TPA: hypothetical protein ACI1IR_004359 [Yersinia enterocolitica]